MNTRTSSTSFPQVNKSIILSTDLKYADLLRFFNLIKNDRELYQMDGKVRGTKICLSSTLHLN